MESRLLGFGSKVRVLEPQDIAENIRREAKAITKNYECT